MIHQHCFYAHNPLEEGPADAEELPDWCHTSGFLLINCSDFARDCYHQDPHVQRNVVRVPGRSVHWFPGSVQFGIRALPYKGHNLRNKGHPTLGRMPFITIDGWRKKHDRGTEDKDLCRSTYKCPVVYRPYRTNQYLSTEDKILEHQHHLIHQSNLLRVGGGATTLMGGKAALRLLAINALAQAYEQQFETGNDEDDEENDNSDGGNSEANDNRKPAAVESSKETDNQKQAADDSSESTDNRKQQADENSQWMVDEGKSSKCAVLRW